MLTLGHAVQAKESEVSALQSQLRSAIAFGLEQMKKRHSFWQSMRREKRDYESQHSAALKVYQTAHITFQQIWFPVCCMMKQANLLGACKAHAQHALLISLPVVIPLITPPALLLADTGRAE